MTELQIAEVFWPLFDDTDRKRYYVSDGGRGGGRSWAFARALLIKGVNSTERILCCREFQSSMSASVHQLLKDQIEILGLSSFYNVTRENITGKNGTIILFKGLHHNSAEIKSMEGITICWAEEAERVSEESWNYLIPTIFRRSNSELWITFNPYKESDPTYQRFIINPPPNTIRMKAGWKENPWFPDGLRLEMEHDRKNNPDRYSWVWEGQPLGISDAQIYKGRYEVMEFEHQQGERLYLGADWGFAQDPTTLIRCFIRDRKLYIDYEAYGIGIDIDDTPALFKVVPQSDKWTIYADNARPETISYMKRNGYPLIKSCRKGPGSVEDGIEHIKSYDKIIIHPRCKHTIEEFELYRYKQDKQTGEILPIIVDKDNHCQDALRYAVNDLVKSKSIGQASKQVRSALGYA